MEVFRKTFVTPCRVTTIDVIATSTLTKRLSLCPSSQFSRCISLGTPSVTSSTLELARHDDRSMLSKQDVREIFLLYINVKHSSCPIDTCKISVNFYEYASPAASPVHSCRRRSYSKLKHCITISRRFHLSYYYHLNLLDFLMRRPVSRPTPLSAFAVQLCPSYPAAHICNPTLNAHLCLTRCSQWHCPAPPLFSHRLSNQLHMHRSPPGLSRHSQAPNPFRDTALHRQPTMTVSESANDTRYYREMIAVRNMKAFAHSGRWDDLHREYTSFVEPHGPAERVLTVYIRLQGRAGRISYARDAILSSPSADCAQARTAFMKAIARNCSAQMAFDELFNTPSSLWSPHACTAVLHAVGLAERSDLVDTILTEALNRGVVIDITMFDAALRSLGRGGRLREAFQLLSRMTNCGIQPTSNTMEALIYACAHVQDDYKDTLFVQSIGRRACVVYEAAVQKNLVSPAVLSAFASVVLRSRLWNDHRVPSLIDNMRDALKLGPNRLKRFGVTSEKFQAKLVRILYLRSNGSDTYDV